MDGGNYISDYDASYSQCAIFATQPTNSHKEPVNLPLSHRQAKMIAGFIGNPTDRQSLAAAAKHGPFPMLIDRQLSCQLDPGICGDNNIVE